MVACKQTEPVMHGSLAPRITCKDSDDAKQQLQGRRAAGNMLIHR